MIPKPAREILPAMNPFAAGDVAAILRERKWLRRDQVDSGGRPGITTTEHGRIRELEREIRELRRANEILKAASVFFAGELDPRRLKL